MVGNGFRNNCNSTLSRPIRSGPSRVDEASIVPEHCRKAWQVEHIGLRQPEKFGGIEQMCVGIREFQVGEYVAATVFGLHVVGLHRSSSTPANRADF